MRTVLLARGETALVDDEDYDVIAQYHWYAHKRRHNCQYAVTTTAPVMAMHRMILSARTGQQIDHRNGDGLDNRRCNLRFVDHSQNQQNRHSVASRSGYRGVTFHKQCQRWQAAIKHHGTNHYLGLFETAELAARAYDQAAAQLFGDFANPNFPDAA